MVLASGSAVPEGEWQRCQHAGYRGAATRIRPDEVHVWRTKLVVDDDSRRQLALTLSPDERERASRMRSPLRRDAFVVGRGTLRAILAGYLGTTPGAVALGTGTHGKPVLSGGGGLRFNLSHTASFAVYAVGRGREVGVDLERVDRRLDFDRIARRFFSPPENEQLLSVPEGARRRSFFAAWTRKEAFAKARGEGLSLAFDRFTVSVGPDRAAQLLSVDGQPDEAARWSLHDLEPAPGLVASLAVEGNAGTPRLRDQGWFRRRPIDERYI
ncbi:MAG: 4'-phosphopantetheinyl transferase family protein [Acidimicrobiales bacterium]